MVTPVLLKRLAEAVDGHRTGASVWVVASYEPSNPILGVFEGRLAAERFARDSAPSGYSVFGPYQSPRDPGTFVAFLARCRHDRRTSYMVPAGMCPFAPLRLSDVDSVTMSVRLTNGTTQQFPLSADVDAVFFTLAAIDKFVIPYYTRIVGVDSAAAMRRDIVNRLP